MKPAVGGSRQLTTNSSADSFSISFMSSGDLPETGQKTVFVRAMFDDIAHRYDLVNRVMTLGLDRGWRKKTVASMDLPPGAAVLDLGCGTGDLTREATKAGFNCVGIDLSFEMLAQARNIHSPLIEADASALPISSSCVDGVVSGFALRNFTDQRAVLLEVARVLVPGGRLAILEVDRPRHAIVRAGHAVWFKHVVPIIGALFSVASAYRYLPKSIAYLPSPVELEKMLSNAGFHSVKKRQLQGGLAQIVTATRSINSP
jgi:demethylmenaquinone methyltransferase/2-methoxy-6-polyprenyl-1,4-benzoquinol methylase